MAASIRDDEALSLTAAPDVLLESAGRIGAAAPMAGTVRRPLERIPLVYVLAASHSGSTLLAMVLGAHPDICTVGELNLRNLGHPGHYRCSCGRWLRDCDFWKGVSSSMRRHGLEFDVSNARTDFRLCGGALQRRLLRPLHRGRVLETIRDLALSLSPGWSTAHAQTQARNRALARSVLEVSQKPVLVDSSKGGLRLKYLLRDGDFDVRVIRLVRDGRAVALTYLDSDRFADATDATQRGGGAGQPRPAVATSWAEAARLWKRSNQEAETLMRHLPSDRRIELRYEDFCASPARSLERLLTFLQVDPRSATLDFRSRPQHVVGNGMRMDRTTEIRLDERWRGVLSAPQLREFDAIAGALNRSYGYA